MRTRIFILPVICVFFSTFLYGQKNCPYKFGKVSPEDFQLKDLKADTSGGAIILADVGSTGFDGNTFDKIHMLYKRYRRVKIINSKGFALGKVEIPLYSTKGDVDIEKVDNLKACTYNLEDGKVVETKLTTDEMVDEKISKSITLKNFTLPAIREGSIIEYSYTIVSLFYEKVRPWNFEENYPVIWSEFNFEFPDIFEYSHSGKWIKKFDITEERTEIMHYNIVIPNITRWSSSHVSDFTTQIGKFRWVMKNLPAMKKDSFISSMENNRAGMQFRLTAVKYPDTPIEEIVSTWRTVLNPLSGSDFFGEAMKKDNDWLDAKMNAIMKGAAGEQDKITRIYQYVRDNFKSKGVNNIYPTKPLDEVFSSKTGYAQDINLLLTAMIRHENITACPVILGTADHGYINEKYPSLEGFNYVITMVTIGGVNYFLDAAQPWLGFAKLPLYVYNGHAKAINADMSDLDFSPDTLSESKRINATLLSDLANPGKWTGDYVDHCGYFESCDTREMILREGKEKTEKKLKEVFKGRYSAGEIVMEGLENKNIPLQIHKKISIDASGNLSEISLNPMLNTGYKENPFASAHRKYPVELHHLTDVTFVLKLQIPEGYVVEELPKSERIVFNEDEGMYEYIISQSGNEINFRSRLKIDKATFSADDYENLREFFGRIVKKQAENIVFKKKE